MKRKSGINDHRTESTPEDRLKYMEAWTKMMVTIWREKIERLHVWNTWNLHRTLENDVLSVKNMMNYAQITHSFMEYGIFQDMGVGNGFQRGNGGDLGFTPLREPREWYSRAYFASVMVLQEQMAYMYGEEFCSLIADAMHNADTTWSTSARSRAWGTRGRR